MGVKKIGDIVLVQLSDVDSNIYILDDTIIDAGTGFNFTRLGGVFHMLKKDMGGVKQVINTHHHFDHTGGNGYFLNGEISIHETDAPALENGDGEVTMADFFGGQAHKREVKTKLKDGDKIKLGSMELEVIHTPGHTAGSICLYDRKRKILFSGDTIFADGVGRTDLVDSDPEALKQSVEKLAQLDVEKILPGHGEIVDKEAKKRIEYILKTADFSASSEEGSDTPA